MDPNSCFENTNGIATRRTRNPHVITDGDKCETEPDIANSESVEFGHPTYLTVLMCDIVDSTSLSNELVPQDLGVLLSEYYSECSIIADFCGGKVIRCIGDGVLCIFHSSNSLESNAISAVQAAEKMKNILRTKKFSVVIDRQKISTRISIVSGIGIPAHLNMVDQDVIFGRLPFIADRLKKFARKNQIVVDLTTANLVEKKFKVAKLMKFRVPVLVANPEIWLVKFRIPVLAVNPGIWTLKNNGTRKSVQTNLSVWECFWALLNYPLPLGSGGIAFLD